MNNYRLIKDYELFFKTFFGCNLDIVKFEKLETILQVSLYKNNFFDAVIINSTTSLMLDNIESINDLLIYKTLKNNELFSIDFNFITSQSVVCDYSICSSSLFIIKGYSIVIVKLDKGLFCSNIHGLLSQNKRFLLFDFLETSEKYLNLLEMELILKCKLCPQNRCELDDLSNIMKDVVLYMKENITELITIGSISDELQISERTIQLYFAKYIGLSPKNILQGLRFYFARKALLEASINEKVYEVVSHLQFWHMGQFSKDYFGYFGEYPLDTLRRLG